MKSKLLLALTAGLLFCSSQQKAQVSSYAFTQTLSTYGTANTGTLVGPAIQDDDVTSVALPFTFTFNGTAQTTINVGSNGYLSFDASIPGNMYDDVLYDSGTSNVIAPFGADLYKGMFITADMTQGSATITNVSSTVGLSVGTIFDDTYIGDFTSNPTIVSITGNTIVLNQTALYTYTSEYMIATNGTIKQNVSGVSPNRICEFEYSHFSRYLALDEILNFKVRLFETSNKIEVLYKVDALEPSYSDCAVGLKGASTSDYNIRSVVSSVNTWSSSSAATSVSDVCDFDNTIFPLAGQSYMWSPPTCTVPVLAVTPTNSLTCPGASVVLTATGAATYSWTNGPSTSQQTITPTTTTTYTLIGANASCTTSLTYTQNVAATPTLSIASSNTLSCAGQSLTLTATGATSYSWNTVAGTSQTVVAPSTITTYSLSGSNGTCAASATYTQNIAVTPTLSIASSNTVSCAGQSLTLTATGATSYSWNTVAGTTQTVVTPSTTTTYSLTGSNGTCTAAQAFTQTVMAYPVLTITHSPTLICVGQSATITVSGATSYSYNNVAGTSTMAITPNTTTTYSITGSNGTCATTQTVSQTVVTDCATGIKEANLESVGISAYPNPFSSALNIKNASENELTISVSDALGKVIYTSKLKGQSTETISGDALSNGLYFISVQGANGAITKKLIKN